MREKSQCSAGERVINLVRRENLLDHQTVALQRQGVDREKWEEIPWTGHMCYLFTAAWEVGRLRATFMKDEEYDACDQVLKKLHVAGFDWHHGDGEPYNWEKRCETPTEQWTEKMQRYQRNLQIQSDC